MIKLGADNFESEVTCCEGTVLVVFTAPWCGYCHSMLKALDMIKDRLEGVKLAVVDIEESDELANRLSIKSVPTSVVFSQGKESARVSGLLSKARILSLLKLR